MPSSQPSQPSQPSPSPPSPALPLFLELNCFHRAQYARSCPPTARSAVRLVAGWSRLTRSRSGLLWNLECDLDKLLAGQIRLGRSHGHETEVTTVGAGPISHTLQRRCGLIWLSDVYACEYRKWPCCQLLESRLMGRWHVRSAPSPWPVASMMLQYGRPCAHVALAWAANLSILGHGKLHPLSPRERPLPFALLCCTMYHEPDQPFPWAWEAVYGAYFPVEKVGRALS